jgi:hypothetical protein
MSNPSTKSYLLSARVQQAFGGGGGADWWLTVIYGPSKEADKPSFLAELHDLWQIRMGPWLLADDFNLIYWAEDKSNDRLNRRLMGQFRHFLSDAAL